MNRTAGPEARIPVTPPNEVGTHEEGVDTSAVDFVQLILSVLLPPLGVFLKLGFSAHFWLNIVLTLLGYIPGVIHAVYVIGWREEPNGKRATS